MSADVVCFGGAHIDCSAYSVGPVVAGASNPVRRRTSVGGVARNVAVRLAAAGISTALVSRVGSDNEARAVLDDLARNGVDCAGVQRDGERPTAYYTALIDPSGELSVGWADMDVYEALTADRVTAAIAGCPSAGEARGWFIDSNLPAATLQAIADHCPPTTWLAADTISPAKAVRLKDILPRLDYLFCNRLAAATLLDVAVNGPSEHATTELARALTALGVGTAIVTDGPRGLALATADGVRQLPPPVDRVTGDVTGAGDSLVAGTLAGLARGEPIDLAILRGLAAARLTLSKRGA